MFGDDFEAKMGAEAIRELMDDMDLDDEVATEPEPGFRNSPGQTTLMREDTHEAGRSAVSSARAMRRSMSAPAHALRRRRLLGKRRST